MKNRIEKYERKRKCVPCKIEGISNYSSYRIDGIPVCKHHYNIWKSEFENIGEDENFED